MNRDQVFLAVLTGVVTRALPNGLTNPLVDGAIDYGKIIKVTDSVTCAVMNRIWPKHQMERSMRKESTDEDILRDMVECQNDIVKQKDEEIARLNECLATAQGNYNDAYKTIEAKEMKILELKSQLDDALKAVDVLNATVDQQHGKLRDAKTEIHKLQADKDVLRKAVEDGAMEIERLKRDPRPLVKPWVVVEATVEEPEWVTQDRVPARYGDHYRWVWGGESPSPWVVFGMNAEKDSPLRHGYVDEIGDRFEVRCRPQDLPPMPVAEDNDKYVQIVDPEHVLRDCDEGNARRNFESIEDCLQTELHKGAGWVPCKDLGIIGTLAKVYGDSMVFRCKLKDLHVTPPSAESST